LKHAAATKDKPPGVYPGVLKQLQFVWGENACNCNAVKESAPAPAAATFPAPAAAASSNSSSSPGSSGFTAVTGSNSSSSLSGRRLAEASSISPDSRRLQELRRRRLQDLWRRRQLPATETGDELATAAADGSSSSSQSGRISRLQQHLLVAAGAGLDGIHRMLSVISPDSRQPCPLLTYPYKTLGQISAKATDGGFVCSGGLIGEDRVLTAGHCVWDDRGSQGPFQDLSFSPAQWKKDGKITAPLGQVDWDYVTLFEAYVNDPDGEGLAYDISVITLKRAVGRTLGYLGIRADTSPCRSTAMNLTLAGYPGDDPEYPIPGGWQGGCFYDTCTVNFSCAVSITNHTCDSYVGQSGAPMYDRENYIRAVHTLGVLPGFSTSNGAITIQKFILDNVMGYWKDTTGFAPAPPGSIGSGMYY
jgi:V8-like Glu-specific endopeptidase